MIGFIILVGLDQWTKGLVVAHLKGNGPYVIWDGVFEFLYSENRGAAFGMMQEKQLFFFLIALAVDVYKRQRTHCMPQEQPDA